MVELFDDLSEKFSDQFSSFSDILSLIKGLKDLDSSVCEILQIFIHDFPYFFSRKVGEESDGITDISEQSFWGLETFIQQRSDDLSGSIDNSFEGYRRGEVSFSEVCEEVLHFVAFVDTLDGRFSDGYVLEVVEDSFSDLFEDINEGLCFLLLGIWDLSIAESTETVDESETLEIVGPADLVVQVHLPQDHPVLVALFFVKESLDHVSELHSCVIELLFIEEPETHCEAGKDIETVVLESP